jgi:putative ABC transport system ATP-binding protein
VRANEVSVTLRASNIAVRIGSRTVLDGVDLEAAPGQVLAVTGPAGAGKTTLLHVLAGIISPTEGTVTVNGDHPPGHWRAAATSIGFVAQTFGLAAALSMEENIALPLQLLKLPRAEVADRVQNTISALGMENAGRQLATELSGGQQQKAAVGRAIVAEPRLIIADEPTSELDSASRDLVFGLFRAAAERGANVVVATHDPDLVQNCDRVITLANGLVVS